jgi:site-specific recombinase XerD
MLPEVESYLQKLADEGKAPATVRVYGMALKRFTGWLADRPPTGANVNAYVRYLQTELALRPRTIRPAMAAVRGYLGWMQDTGQITGAPLKIKLPALDAPDSYCPTDAEMERIWRCVEELPQKTAHQVFVRRRTLTVLALIAWAGLRHSELQALELGDIDLPARRLRIRCGKGSKTDWLPLSSPDLRDYLAEWLKVREAWAAKHQPVPPVDVALLPTDRARKWGDAGNRAMWDWINRTVKPAKRITDHCLRRYYGTTLNRRGVSLADTSRLMRHSNIASTLDYLKWDNASIAEGAAKMGRGAVHPTEPEPKPPPPPNSPPRVESKPEDRRAWLRQRRKG